MTRHLALAATILIAPAGCTSEPLDWSVDLRTDLLAGPEFADVRVRVFRPGSTAAIHDVVTNVDPSADYLEGVRVAELTVDGPGEYILRTTLLDVDGVEVVERDILADLAGDLASLVLITRNCTGIVCPSPTGDPSLTTCLDGVCVSPSCSAETPAACEVVEPPEDSSVPEAGLDVGMDAEVDGGMDAGADTSTGTCVGGCTLGWSCTAGVCERPPGPPAGGADQYLVGDWDGDGDDNLAVRHGECVWMDVDEDSMHDIRQCFGNPGDVYLVGDWNGDGRDNLGLLRDECVLLDHDFDGTADGSPYCFGNPGDIYFAGDWDGDGDDDIAVKRAECLLMDTNGGGAAEVTHCLGNPSDVYLVGDWAGDGDDEQAVRRGECTLIDEDRNGLAERTVCFGNAGDTVLVGDWDGDSDDDLGVLRAPGCVHLDLDDVGGATDGMRCYGNWP